MRKYSYTRFLEIYQKIPHGPILFLGNGIHQCKEILQATFGDRAYFPFIKLGDFFTQADWRNGAYFLEETRKYKLSNPATLYKAGIYNPLIILARPFHARAFQ